jgi:hypothetical protein
MNTQRRVTAPPGNKAEVVTDSLRPDSPGTPVSIATNSGQSITAQAPPQKEFSWIPILGPGFFAQEFSPSDLILPDHPGEG